MKVLFKNTTKYTKENCNDFIEFHSNKYGRKELIKILLFLFCIIYILIFNFINRNWLLILVTIFISFIIYFFKNNKVNQKANKKQKVREYTFYFYEKHIKIKYKRNFDRLKYFQLHKIFETSEYFFLYLDEKNSLILNKNGFEVGTPKSFSKFIKNKCPLKYRDEEK